MNSNSALLITSAQFDLLHPMGGAWGLVGETVKKNDVVANLMKLTNAARSAGVPVLHSPIALDYAAMEGFEPLSVIQKLVVENKLLAKDSVGAGFIPELAPRPGDIVLAARQGFSSFWANDIDARLKALGTKTLYIAGMLSHACVESHARDATEKGYRAIVVRDGTAAAGAELLEASYKILSLHCWKLVTTEEAIGSW